MPRILTNSTTIFLVFNILIKNRTHFIHMKSLIAARMLSANHLLCIKIIVVLFLCVFGIRIGTTQRQLFLLLRHFTLNR